MWKINVKKNEKREREKKKVKSLTKFYDVTLSGGPGGMVAGPASDLSNESSGGGGGGAGGGNSVSGGGGGGNSGANSGGAAAGYPDFPPSPDSWLGEPPHHPHHPHYAT